MLEMTAERTALTKEILGCCFDVMNKLGVGFLESVYRNALVISLNKQGMKTYIDLSFDVIFEGQKVGIFIPDLVVENEVIVELKTCETLVKEHQAQLINYLAVTKLKIGLLVNFGKRKIEYKRLYHPAYPPAPDKHVLETSPDPVYPA